MLLAPRDRGLDAGFLQPRLERVEDLVHHLAAVAARALHRLREHPVAQRIEVRERELLQLAVQPVEAEPVGDRRVDLDRLARDAVALLHADRVERAHVVQPVGELDQDDAHVARHREEHLAEVLGLRVLGVLELDAVELGDAVDELGDGLAEALADVLLRDGGVLEDVVQQRGDERLGVELPVRQDLGDRDRVRDVRLARLAVLPLVGGVAEVVRLFEAGEVGRLEVSGDALLEAFEGGDRGRHGASRSPVRAGGLLDAVRSRARRGKSPGQFWWTRFSISNPTLPAASSRKREHGRLVAHVLEQRRAALRELARAVGRDQRELETVGDALEAIVYGDSGHRSGFSRSGDQRRHGRVGILRSPAWPAACSPIMQRYAVGITRGSARSAAPGSDARPGSPLPDPAAPRRTRC